MNVVDEIKKIEGFHLIYVLVGFVGIIGPGLLTIFLFKRPLFLTLDLMKLILLASCISLPVVCFNTFLAALTPDGKDKPEPTESLFTALVFSSLVCYPALIAAYFFGIAFHNYAGTILALELIVVLVAIREYFKDKKEVSSGA